MPYQTSAHENQTYSFEASEFRSEVEHLLVETGLGRERIARLGHELTVRSEVSDIREAGSTTYVLVQRTNPFMKLSSSASPCANIHIVTNELLAHTPDGVSGIQVNHLYLDHQDKAVLRHHSRLILSGESKRFIDNISDGPLIYEHPGYSFSFRNSALSRIKYPSPDDEVFNMGIDDGIDAVRFGRTVIGILNSTNVVAKGNEVGSF